jgi:hypothetical protein
MWPVRSAVNAEPNDAAPSSSGRPPLENSEDWLHDGYGEIPNELIKQENIMVFRIADRQVRSWLCRSGERRGSVFPSKTRSWALGGGVWLCSRQVRLGLSVTQQNLLTSPNKLLASPSDIRVTQRARHSTPRSGWAGAAGLCARGQLAVHVHPALGDKRPRVHRPTHAPASGAKLHRSCKSGRWRA